MDDEYIEFTKIKLRQKAVKVKPHEKDNSSAVSELNVVDVKLQLEQISEQAGVPAVNLNQVKIDLKILDILPREIALQHLILPFAVAGNDLNLAMVSPNNSKVIEEIEFVSGKKVFPHIALNEQLVPLIDICYNAKDSNEAFYTGSDFGAPSRPSSPPLPVFTGNKAVDREISGARRLSTGTVRGRSSKYPLSAENFNFDIEMDVPLEQQLMTMAQAKAEATSYIPKNTKKILVVDDEDDIRLLITRVLTDKGFEVVTASRGLEAVQMVQNEEPDMIILDAMLPEVHGFDICRKIKGSKKYGHIPVIMISAIYRGWRYAQDLKDSYGVDDFIEKPFKLAEFLEKVQKHLNDSDGLIFEDQEIMSQKTDEILTQSIIAYKQGDIDGAIELLRQGIDIDPLSYKLHYNLALLLGKKSLNYQAIRELESTLELEPNYFPAMKNLALLYQKAGFKFKAIETWERSLHYCPNEETRIGIKQHLMDIL